MGYARRLTCRYDGWRANRGFPSVLSLGGVVVTLFLNQASETHSKPF